LLEKQYLFTSSLAQLPTAEKAVKPWRDNGKLPFPGFDLEFRKTHRDILDSPPTASSKAKEKGDK
jgi:hypothetical protein